MEIHDPASREKVQAAFSLDFRDLIEEKTLDFTGREWALSEFDRWLAEPTETRFFVITGELGSGKTALAAQMTRARQISAHHFCRADQPMTLDPRAFVRSILGQLINSNSRLAAALLQGNGPKITVNMEVQEVKSARGSLVPTLTPLI
jgi:hypothetical protein